MGVPIVVYIHVCQLPKWQIPFQKIMTALKESGLYDRCQEIRLGIVNEQSGPIDESLFNETKITTKFYNHCSLYERATLSHMRNMSENESCQYAYLHTKGIKPLNGPCEHEKNCVLDWIDLMLHWNIYNWKIASEKLFKNDIYGCEFFRNPKLHFSGNFWWANSDYLKTLPRLNKYNVANLNRGEFWILSETDKVYAVSGPTPVDMYQNYYHKAEDFPSGW